MSSKLNISVRGKDAEVVLASPVDRFLYTEDQLLEFMRYPARVNIPVYVDFGQSDAFNAHTWTIVGPSGYTQTSPQKTTTSFIFKFTIPGQYTATLNASYTAPSNQSQANNWSEQETIRFLVQNETAYPYKMPDMSFMSKYLPSVYQLVDNISFTNTLWSSIASLVGRELVSAVEVDFSKSIETFPEVFQKKWLQLNPSLSAEEFNFKNFYFIKPIVDPSIVVSSESSSITPSNFFGWSQITNVQTFEFTVEDYNSLSLPEVPVYISNLILTVTTGVATGFTFRVDSISGNRMTISPKLPIGFEKGDILKAKASSQLGAKGLLINFTDNSTGDEYTKTLVDVRINDSKLIIDSPLPPGTYTAEMHSSIHSFSSLEDLGVSPGDRLIVDVHRGDYATASLPVEIYKVKGSAASIRVELGNSTLSFSDLALFLFLQNLMYTGAYLSPTGDLEFHQDTELDGDGELQVILSSAETAFTLFKYPIETLGFEVFPDTTIKVGDTFTGKIIPRFLIRNTKVNKPENIQSINELRNFIVEQQEYIEDGFIKSVTSEGEVFLKGKKSITLFEGSDFSLTQEEDFITFYGFNFNNSLPKILWSPIAIFSNHEKLENNFAKAAGLTYTEFVDLTTSLSYKQVVQGLLFSFCEGATSQSIEIGLHLLLDIPIVTEESLVTIMAEPLGEEFHYQIQNTDTQQLRSIYLPRREYISPLFSATGLNRFTKNSIEEGDIIPAYSPLSQFIKITDKVGLSTLPDEIHKWQALVDVSVVDSSLIPKTKKYLDNIKPAYTYVDFIFVLFLVDTVNLLEGQLSKDIHFLFLDTIGPYQSERSVDSWAHGALLRRFDSASFALRTLFYGRGLLIAPTYVIPNTGTQYNPWKASDTEYENSEHFGTLEVRTGSSDTVQAGDILVVTTGINQGLYEITSTSDPQWFISPLSGESIRTPVANGVREDFYVVRVDTNSSNDSDDEWEEVSPLDVPSIELDFGANVISGTTGTLTQDTSSFTDPSQTFEVLNVRPGDIIIIDSVEHEILTVSGSAITISDQSTFTNKQYVVRRFL